MSFSVNTNIASLQAQNYLRLNSDFQSKTIYRVTSGLRIISSGDDAAGLAIANAFRSDQAVLTQGIRNANDGLSTLQTIDGGMNNISQLLDRARTLATQSASGTFSGNRDLLNSEFQSVMAEIDRQAQSIGLDNGGQFAKALSVFIGGGRSNNGVSTIDNGSVSVDLTSSTVDTKGLGLKGSPAQNATTYSLGSDSNTSVANVVAANSSDSTADFYFSGPGFGTDSKVKVSVTAAGLTDTDTLVSALNTAIDNAGNAGNAAATAFKNAGIRAQIITDADGNKMLAFTSDTAAFQVESGNVLGNALMGNFLSAGSAVGASLTTQYQAGATAGDTTALAGDESVVLRFQGGSLKTPYDLSFTIDQGSSTATNFANLKAAVAADATLAAAGITVAADSAFAAGSTLKFNNSRGEDFSVMASGDTGNALGLGSFLTGANSAATYTTLQAANTYPATARGTATFEFSLNGAASAATAASVQGSSALAATIATNAAPYSTTPLALTIDGTSVSVDFTSDPNKAANESRANVVAFINSTIRTALGLGSDVSIASLDGSNNLVLTDNIKGASSSIKVTDSATSRALGLTTSADVTASGTGASAISINLSGGTATAASVSSTSALAATLDTSDGTGNFTGGKALVFTIDGSASITADFTNDTNKNAAETLTNIALFLNTTAQKALGTSATIVQVVNSKIVFTSPTTGKASSITVTDAGAASASRLLNLTSAPGTVSAAGTEPTGADLASRLNQAFASSTTLQKAGLEATYSATTTKFTISSSNGSYFRLNAYGANADLGFGTTGTAFSGNTAATLPTTSQTFASGGVNESSKLGFTPIKYGSDQQTVTIASADGSGALQTKTVTLTASNARSIDEAVYTINSQLQATNNPTLKQVVAFKINDAGTEKIQFASEGAFTVSLGANANTEGMTKAGSQNTSDDSTVSSGGATVDIGTQSGAQAAVNSLASAVSTLGSAQAVVGKGQNNFNYAINLAQSQVSNLAAAESRIRDADLAAEAANLTKAQILLQAGTAALAQANSAPQAILTLLRG